MTPAPVSGRYPEIDLVRGLAVAMMVIYHFLFDLWFFGIYPAEVTTGFWKAFAVATASLFLLLVGISFTISASRVEFSLSGRDFFLKYLMRGAMILGIAACITLATWVYLGQGFVIFGILHLIGVSVILAPFFYHKKSLALYAGIGCIITGLLLGGIRGPAILIPFGVYPGSFYSVDYTPIFPWFGLVLIGIYLGEQWYPGGIRRFNVPGFFRVDWWNRIPAAFVEFCGRHSLAIYILHQPVIILLLHPPWG